MCVQSVYFVNSKPNKLSPAIELAAAAAILESGCVLGPQLVDGLERQLLRLPRLLQRRPHLALQRGGRGRGGAGGSGAAGGETDLRHLRLSNHFDRSARVSLAPLSLSLSPSPTRCCLTGPWSRMHLCKVLLLSSLAVTTVYANSDSSITFHLAAQHELCFFEDAVNRPKIQMEFQVLDGGGRDVDYTIYKPNGQLLRQGRRLMETYFEEQAADNGPWRFCFSNSFSLLQSKKIFFALTMLSEADESLMRNKSPEDLKIDSITQSINTINRHLKEVIRVQSHLWAREARHRFTVETNHFRVNMFSAIQLAFIILIGVAQVFIVRHFFTPNGPRIK